MIWLPVIVFLMGAGVVSHALRVWTPYMNRPEQHAQVEVIGKRIAMSSPDDSDIRRSHHIVAFKFSGGSVKEIAVGDSSAGERRTNAIDHGDTGVLIYIEREDIEEAFEDEDERWLGRRFYSFEKDAEYGGLKIVNRDPSDKTWIILIGALFGTVFLFAIWAAIYDIKRNT